MKRARCEHVHIVSTATNLTVAVREVVNDVVLDGAGSCTVESYVNEVCVDCGARRSKPGWNKKFSRWQRRDE